jgi:hypothetical protein
VISILLDKLVNWTLMAALWVMQLVEPFMRSKTGSANARVAHIRGALGYHVHSYWVGLPNIDRWLRHGDELFPAVLQVQTINRCNATCAMCPYPYTIHLEPREVMGDALYTKIVEECADAPELYDFVPMAKNEPLLDPKLEARIAEFKAIHQPKRRHRGNLYAGHAGSLLATNDASSRRHCAGRYRQGQHFSTLR